MKKTKREVQEWKVKIMIKSQKVTLKKINVKKVGNYALGIF
jgi:hypothetical protein